MTLIKFEDERVRVREIIMSFFWQQIVVFDLVNYELIQNVINVYLSEMK